MRRWRLPRLALALATTALTLGIAAGATATPADRTPAIENGVPAGAICTVNGDPIKRSKYLAALNIYLDFTTIFGVRRPLPGNPNYRAATQAALDGLVVDAIIKQAAADEHVTVDEAEVSKRIASTKKALGSDFAGYLRFLGISEADYRDTVRNDLRVERLMHIVTHVVTISDEEVESVYRHSSSQFVIPAHRRTMFGYFRHRDRARAFYQAASQASAREFARLLKEWVDADRRTDGTGTTIYRGELGYRFERILFHLPTGAVSLPRHTEVGSGGWTVMRANGPVIPARQQPLSEVRDSLRRDLRTIEQIGMFGLYLADRVSSADVVCRDNVAYDPGPGLGSSGMAAFAFAFASGTSINSSLHEPVSVSTHASAVGNGYGVTEMLLQLREHPPATLATALL